MVRGRRDRGGDWVGGARGRGVATRRRLAGWRSAWSRRWRCSRRLGAPGVGALRRLPQLAHRAHGVLAVAVPGAGALGRSRAGARPLARAGGGGARDCPRAPARRPAAAVRRKARAPPRARGAGHGRGAPGARGGLGQLVDAGRPLVERSDGARPVGALPRRRHGGRFAGFPAARSPDAVPALVARPARKRNVLLIVDESVRAAEVCSVPGRRAGTSCDAAPGGRRAAAGPVRVHRDAGARLDDDAVDRRSDDGAAARRTPRPPADGADAPGVRACRRDRRGLLDGAEPPLRELRSLSRRPSARGVRERHRDCAVRDLRDGRRRRASCSTARSPTRRGCASRTWRSRSSRTRTSRTSSTTTTCRSRAAATGGEWIASGRRRFAIATRSTVRTSCSRAFSRRFARRPGGARTVVIFLSDHGEQLGERGLIGHTWTVHDEEIRVPMWIDAPPGTLTDGEAAELRALQECRWR